MEFFFSSTLPFVFVVAEGTPPLPPPKPSSSFVIGASPPTIISVSPSSVRVAFSASITCFSFDRESTRKFLFKFPPMLSLALQNLSFPSVQLDAPPRRSGESKIVSLAISDPSASSCAFLGTARREMIVFFCDTLLFERSSKAFFSFAFFVALVFHRTKKSLRRREKTHTRAFFHFFRLSLSSFLRESQKNFYFPPDRQREKRYKNREHKSAVKEMPFLLLLFLLLLAKSVVPILRAVVRRSFSLFFSRESSGSRWGVF